MVLSDESFWSAAIYVPVVVLASVIKIMNYPLQTGILYAKKTKYFFYIGLVAAVVSVVANLSLIPIYGIFGACLALILTDSIITFLMHIISQKYFYVKYEYRKIIIVFAIAVMIYGVSFILPQMNIFTIFVIKILLMFLFVWLLFFKNYLINTDEAQNLLKYMPNNIKKLLNRN